MSKLSEHIESLTRRLTEKMKAIDPNYGRYEMLEFSDWTRDINGRGIPIIAAGIPHDPSVTEEEKIAWMSSAADHHERSMDVELGRTERMNADGKEEDSEG